MSDRNVIWVRDALVILFSCYVVFAVTMAPWSNLKMEEPLPDDCGNGCAPLVKLGYAKVGSVSFLGSILDTDFIIS